jgi:hypothetical protein
LIVSPSQLADVVGAKGCLRKWWFERRVKLPGKFNDGGTGNIHTAQGHVLHAVAERYLLLGPTGRGSHQLYPEGWADELIDHEPDPEARLRIQEHIKALIDLAIGEGLLQRPPTSAGSLVEERVGWMVIPPTQPGGDHVYLTGYVDWAVAHDLAVKDHKSKKNFKYLLSPRELAADTQVLCYAYILGRRWGGPAKHLPPDQRLWLQHLYYSMEEVKVKLVTAEHEAQPGVPWHVIQTHWNDVVVPACEQMLALTRANGGRDYRCEPEASWDKVPGAIDRPGNEGWAACNAYGGCAFQDICSGQESLADYRGRMRRARYGDAVAPSPLGKKLPLAPPDGGGVPKPAFKVAVKALNVADPRDKCCLCQRGAPLASGGTVCQDCLRGVPG